MCCGSGVLSKLTPWSGAQQLCGIDHAAPFGAYIPEIEPWLNCRPHSRTRVTEITAGPSIWMQCLNNHIQEGFDMRHLGLSLVALVWASNALAQDQKISRPDVAATLPASILSSVQSSSVTSIYAVTGDEHFDGQVLKADEIVFAPNSTLTLRATNHPWIVISAKKWKFADPQQWVRINVVRGTGSGGSDGSAGTRGADDPGETNRRGNDGGRGGQGGAGGQGGTQQLPTIYLIGAKYIGPDDNPIPGAIRLAINVSGYPGGRGGDGGKGGDGGNAGNGKEGSTSAFECQDGPGPGGNGGTAGTGGRGGDGGQGGSGGQLVYISDGEGIEQLSYARVVNGEGFGGQGGRPGRPGTPGNGGQGAGSHGWCGGSDAGYRGAGANPSDFGEGNNGADGQKGKIIAVTVTSFAPLFN